jgi:phage-related tail fiber protein
MAKKFAIAIDGGGYVATNFGSPVGASDLATKSYVDGLLQGIQWKNPVRVATTAAGTLATSFANGQTVDGVVLATGDRILIKNQASGGENGIYTVAASGAPTRATDADTAAEILGAVVPVEEGTVNADTFWINQTNAPITLGTTATVWTQFGVMPTVYTGGTGITVVGGTISADHSVVVERYETDIGTGAATSIVVTHNLGTKAVQVKVYDNTTPFSEIEPEVQHTSTNTVTLIFGTAPTTNQFHVIVEG